MCDCQCNAVTATTAQNIITVAACQSDSFIFSDRRLHSDRKQTVRALALYKPDHHIYRVNSVNINGIFQYLRCGFLAHDVCRVMQVFRAVWPCSIPSRLAEPQKQAAEALENSNQSCSR